MIWTALLIQTLIGPESLNSACVRAKAALVKEHGAGETARIERGLWQVRRMWQPKDGTAADLYEFGTSEFMPHGQKLEGTFERLQFALERADGYMRSLSRDLRRYSDLEIGDSLPIDLRLAMYEPSAHLSEDLFESKIAFVALLNFPTSTLAQRLAKGDGWTRREWAEARLTDRFTVRESPASAARLAAAYGRAEAYTNGYNIYTHHLLTRDGKRLFPAGQRLLSHWNLRDEIKAQYGSPEKQRMLARVMEAIVRQTIPASVINNPGVDWIPETGAVSVSNVKDGPVRSSLPMEKAEDDDRYRHWLEVFRAEKQSDKEDPRYPTFLERRFDRYAEIPQARVEKLLISVLKDPLAKDVAKEIERRVGRKLEPFDIYYPAFARPTGDEATLDRIVQSKYPSATAFKADIPRLLEGLGFSYERAFFLSERIVVEPSRGPGHALGAFRKDDTFHLRTRIEPGGMNYKGYNIAVHEMGHNVEQIFSTGTIDYTLIQGVPNNAFTEALAFIFQARDLQLLGMNPPESQTKALNEFWEARQIAGAALVDMYAWEWLYKNPNCTPAAFRQAVVGASEYFWDKYFAPSMGLADTAILGIYSHMVNSGLYLPDYALARLIAFQIETHFASRSESMGAEFERVSRIGRLTPDAWMKAATGQTLSAKPLLDAAAKELAALK